MTLRAIIFDVDGTLAETEDLHRRAFNRVFEDAGHDWHWDRALYRELLLVNGGRERLRHFVGSIGAELSEADAAALHARKNEIYAAYVDSGEVALRPGVARLIDEARAGGVRLAIATTTGRANLEALLTRLLAGVQFDAAVTGEDVRAKKPDPEVYRRALDSLALQASDCVAIEDSRIGLEAATGADIAAVVIPSLYFDDERLDGAALVRASLDGPLPVGLAELRALVKPPAHMP